MTMYPMTTDRLERHRTAMSRLRAFGRELRMILSVALNPTDEEIARMKCLCVAIGDTIDGDTTGDTCWGWDSAAYHSARNIIARHERARSQGNG